MSAIFVLIIISLLVATGFLIAFMWAVGNGQYEDAYGPSVRMLWEDPVPRQHKASDSPTTHHSKPQKHV
ncbi:MAG: cbb3-type cytochrome oxidase assembly protein CcoS [Bacteroidota bacterium]